MKPMWSLMLYNSVDKSNIKLSYEFEVNGSWTGNSDSLGELDKSETGESPDGVGNIQLLVFDIGI